MKALVTGASSGIGRDIARALVCRGWDVILVARRADRLLELKKELGKHAKCVRCDVSKEEECRKLHEVLQGEDIEMLVNCAGFGLCGYFTETSLDRELQMIDTNIKGLHILTKLYLGDFVLKNKGYILNVASVAGFMPGPLTAAISEELRHKGSDVKISAFCPGPVDTEFNNVANVRFTVSALDSKTAAAAALDGVMKGKLYVTPTFSIKCVRLARKLLPDKVMARMCYSVQKKKRDSGKKNTERLYENADI